MFQRKSFLHRSRNKRENGASRFNFATSDRTIEIRSDWKSEEINYECCSVEVIEHNSFAGLHVCVASLRPDYLRDSPSKLEDLHDTEGTVGRGDSVLQLLSECCTHGFAF